MGILVLCGLVIYLPAANGPYLLDDRSNLLFNAGIRMQTLSWPEIEAAATSMSETFANRHAWLNRPLSFISFGLNHWASSTPLMAMKLTNIVLHLINACLVFALLKHLATLIAQRGSAHAPPAHYVALLGAAIWLLHPLMVSTVLYTVQRMTALSTLFSLGALLAFVHYRQALEQNWRALIPGGAWVALLSLLAFLCKENGVLTLPLCALLEVCVFRGRLPASTPSLARHFYRLCLWLPVVVLCAYLLTVYLGAGGNTPSSRLFTHHERLLSQGPVLMEYLLWFVWPSPELLHFLHDGQAVSRSLFAPMSTLWSWLSLGSLIVLIVVLARTQRGVWLSVGLGWFFVGHLLESSVLNLELMFEHRNYLPYIGLAFSTAWGLASALHTLRIPTTARALMGIALVSTPLLTVSAERITHWRSEAALLAHWQTRNADSGRYWTMRAAHFVTQQNIPAAMQALQHGHALQPWEEGFSLGQITLLCAEDRLHDDAELLPALEQARAALSRPPLTAYGITQLIKVGSVCLDKAHHEALADVYRLATQLPHRLTRARGHYMLALLAEQAGQLADARTHLLRARELDPSTVLIQQKLDALAAPFES